MKLRKPTLIFPILRNKHKISTKVKNPNAVKLNSKATEKKNS
jgi:hypothetical protein